MKNKTLLIIVFLYLATVASAQLKSNFSKAQVLADLKELKESLKDAHYNAFAYVLEEEFDAKYNSLKNSVKSDSLSLLETISLFQRLASIVKNGHTNIDFPIQSYIQYAQSGGTLFPLEIAFENSVPLVRKNWSTNKDIEIGDEVLSINGKPIQEILSKIYPQISAERTLFKHVKIEFYTFPRYYWQVFGKHESFEVEVLSNKQKKKYTIKAIKAMEDFEMQRTDIINASKQLKLYGATAYLNPGGFAGDEEKYQQFIDSSFVVINKGKIKNLIVDLRNNPGGNDSFSDYMVSYFADKPFKWNSSFTLKTSKFLKSYTRQQFDTTKTYWQEVLNHEDGEVYDFKFDEYQPQPIEKRFKGKVYALINRQSHSQSAVTAAQIQDNNFGIIVGEETGDYPSLYASIFQYNLTNTAIPVNVSKGYMVRVNGSKKEEGVIPDIFIKDYLLDDQDEILEGLLDRLNNHKSE